MCGMSASPVLLDSEEVLYQECAKTIEVRYMFTELETEGNVPNYDGNNSSEATWQGEPRSVAKLLGKGS